MDTKPTQEELVERGLALQKRVAELERQGVEAADRIRTLRGLVSSLERDNADYRRVGKLLVVALRDTRDEAMGERLDGDHQQSIDQADAALDEARKLGLL